MYSKFHRPNPPKNPTTKKPKTPKYENYNDSSLSSGESLEIPSISEIEEVEKNVEAVRRDLLNSTGEGREPDPLPPPISRKKLVADLVSAYDYYNVFLFFMCEYY